MALLKWLKRRTDRGESAVNRWRVQWAAAIDGRGGNVDELRRQVEVLATTEPDVEVELEMLEALQQLRAVQQTIAGGALPCVETGHRVIGAEPCHFSAPASLPSDQAQVSGRVLLTGSRAVFVGGGRTSVTAWHTVHEVARIQRDVLLARADGSAAAHYRFNTYADAAVSAFLAQQLKAARRARL